MLQHPDPGRKASAMGLDWLAPPSGAGAAHVPPPDLERQAYRLVTRHGRRGMV